MPETHGSSLPPVLGAATRGQAAAGATAAFAEAGEARPSARDEWGWPVIILIAAGIALRVWQYAANRSLWADEVMLALNLINKPIAALFVMLDRNQVAPFGFLALERLAVVFLNGGEYSLRLLPLLAGIVTLPLFWVVARRALDRPPALLALGIFAFSQPLIYFASEVKQYSTDVLVAVILTWLVLAIEQSGITRRTAIVAGLAGALAVWLSQAAVFTLAAAGIALVVRAAVVGRWTEARRVALVAAVWAGSFVQSYAVTRGAMSDGTMAYMHAFWAGHFMPLPPHDLAQVRQLATGIGQFFVDPVGLRVPYRISIDAQRLLPTWSSVVLAGLAPSAAAAGAWALWRAHRRVALAMFTLPVFLLVGASSSGAYPFGGRVDTFLVPAVLCLVANGIVLAWRYTTNPAWRLVVIAAAIGILAAPLRESLSLPYPREEIRPVLEYVVAHREPHDAIYVYYGALQAVEYYAPRFGLTRADYTAGIAARQNPALYRADVARLAATTRVWVVLSHEHVSNGVSEWSVILEQLDAMGERRECFERRGAKACLYELRALPEAAAS